MELVSEGKYYRKKDTQYIMYAESEITGLEGVTTIIKVLDNGNVVLVRTGKMQQRQESGHSEDLCVPLYSVRWYRTYRARIRCDNRWFCVQL